MSAMKNQVDSAKRARIIKATDHPNRLTMPHALADGEKCVCDLRDLVAADRRIKKVFVVGIIRQLTRPQWIVGLAGETTLQGNLAGVVIGVSMYFPNRRGHEVPRREHPKGEEGEGAAGRTDSGGD